MCDDLKNTVEEDNSVKNWIVSITDSQYGHSAYRVTGTKQDVALHLVGIVREDSCSGCWCSGTAKASELSEENEDTLVAYSCYCDGSEVTYFACADKDPVELHTGLKLEEEEKEKT